MRANESVRASRGFAQNLTRRALALLLILAMTLAVFPPIDLQAATQEDATGFIVFNGTQNGAYYNRPVVINKVVAEREGWKTASDGRYKIQITGTPYSVTVQGMTNVDIMFDNVTINRAQTGKTATIPQGSADEFWQASEDLGWHTSGTRYVPTCPFWILDGSDVSVSFGGTNNVFKAGSNLWTIANNSDSTTTLTRSNGNKNYYHGYAGIQISGDSSLTIEGGTVEAWGAHQLTSVTTVEQAKDTYIREFDSNNSNGRPPEVSTNNWAGNDAAGGAGIGGGTDYNYTTDLEAGRGGSDYVFATPGNLTINGGNVTAIGGFKAAGIGGGVNGAMSSDGGVITINGDPATFASNRTNVTAIGSYYAAGIGEGDSTPGGNASNSFTGSYELIINGGIVTAQGGFKAAGIGTTDELSDSSSNSMHINSGMRITLNGGDITAVSGRAQETNNATAAIGAGDGTNMNPYSISIAEGTFVKASSFSKYAISDKGVTATDIPETVVDPNTYMYLAYYGNQVVAANKDRVFNLYEIKRTDAGDFMVVVAQAGDVLKNLTADHCYLGYEESSGQFYLVDASGKTLDVNDDGERDYLAYNDTLKSFTLMWRNPDYEPGTSDAEYFLFTTAQHNAYVPDNVKALQDEAHVSYYFVTPAMKKFFVPKEYTAVAMTLFDPSVYGGKYVLYVPAGDRNKDFYAVIEKRDSGESSGEIKEPDGGHFELDKAQKPGAIAPGDDGVTPDEISNPLTDLVVFNGNTKHLGKTNATVTFIPGTKSYELWLPLGTSQFDLKVKWDVADNVDDVELMVDDQIIEWNIDDKVSGSYGQDNLKITAGKPVVIWITKTDIKDGKTVNSIRYKVVVNIKSDYRVALTDPAKTYDGHEIKQGIDGFLMSGIEVGDPIDIPNGEQQPQYSYSSLPNESNEEKVDIKYRNVWDNTTSVSYRHKYEWDEKGQRLNVTTTCTISGISAEKVTTFTCSQEGEWSVSGNKEELVVNLSNGIWSQDCTFEISHNATGLIITSNSETQTLLNFSLSGPGTPTDGEGTITKEQATESATNLAKQNFNDSADSLSATGQASYSINRETTSTVTFSRGTTNYGSASITKTEQSSGTISVTVARALAGDSAALLAQATDIRYTYVKIATPSGLKTEETFVGDSLPKAAGTYRVSVKITAPKYEATGEREFVIKQKPVTILAIENWRYYLDSIPTPDEVDKPIDITYDEDGTSGAAVTSGAIRYDGVLEADRSGLRLDNEPLGYPLMYFINRVAGEMATDKIIIYANLPPDCNYTFEGFANDATKGVLQETGDHVGRYLFKVSGQVSYRVNGAMFGKYATDSPWNKFYPVTDLSNPSNYTNALWMDANGNWRDTDGVPGPDDSRIDYHSPDNQSHAEYLYFHTVNEGAEAARYAVDVTYGSLSFSYTKTIWDVNNLHYAEAGTGSAAGDDLNKVASVWSDSQPTGQTVHGTALYSNHILIENRSNRPVTYEAIVQLGFHYTMHKYTSGLSDTEINSKDNVLARLYYTYYNESNGVYTMAADPGMVHTGNTGYVTTGKVLLPAVTPQAYTSTLTEAQLRDTLPYSLIRMQLMGIPQVSADVGTLTVRIYPTT